MNLSTHASFCSGETLSAPRGATLALLGGFQLSVGQSLTIPLGAQRLLALLALEDGDLDRAAATERLWPDSCKRRATANFRSALWRGKCAGSALLIDCVGPRIQLAQPVSVDLYEVLKKARQIVGSSLSVSDQLGHQETIDGLSHELLPTWPDDWLLPERARWDQVRLHALETMAQQFLKVQNYLAALESALAAVAIEPIRESAHRIVLKVHIAEGNSACAMKHYHRYRGLLERELGVKPSRQMVELIHPIASV
jgi:DNA-binding SARP family transcriptional activator